MNYKIERVSFRVVRETPTDPRVITGPADVAALVRDVSMIPDDAREHFVMLMLNTKSRVVAWHHVSTGTLDGTLVHARDVFGPALRTMGVKSLVLVHNHPSGDPTPSVADIRLTRSLVEAGRIVEITIHDHVIVANGNESYVSLQEKGLL